MAHSNPRAKMLYLLEESFDLVDMEMILKVAYEKFKLFQTSLLSFRKFYNQKRKLNETLWTICTYNPYEKNGILFCRNLRTDNVKKSIKMIDDFMKARLHNLKGYPLKVLNIFFKSTVIVLAVIVLSLIVLAIIILAIICTSI